MRKRHVCLAFERRACASVVWLFAVCLASAAPVFEQTDVFISGRDGYFAYRIPAIETAPDGSLLAFAEARKYSLHDPGFEKQDIDLVLKRSADGGRTWSPMKIIEDPGEQWSAANPSTLVDRHTKRVWLFYLRGKPERNTYTARPGTDDIQIFARHSIDNGSTWSEPVDLTRVTRDLADPKWRTNVVGPGGGMQSRDGQLAIPVWKFEPWRAFAVVSDDHGRTWQRGEIVPDVSGDEGQLVELADGRWLFDIRQRLAAHRWRATSSDGGKTWSEPHAGEAVSAVACAIERFTLQANGDDRDRLLWTGPKGPQRSNLVVRVSYDEGATFPDERVIFIGPAAYSDLTILKDRTAGVLWERGTNSGYQFISFTRFNREWLESKDNKGAASADLVVRHANVITIDTNQPRAQAFAVTGGKFVAVGTDESVGACIGPETTVFDLTGKTIVPGFIDAHLHPRAIYPKGSRWANVDCSPANVRTIDELIVALKHKAEQTPSGYWVSGSRYQETKLGRQPTRWDLDRASTNHPIIISHSSGHQSVCNSLALRLASVTRDAPDPPGGKFGRDENGELTGLLQEGAASIVRARVPRNPEPPEAETLAGYRDCFRQFLRRGITSVHVAGVSASSARQLEKARTDETPIRLYLMLSEGSTTEAVGRKAESRSDDGVRYGAIKLFHGNSLSAQTCWLSKPYADRPDYFGVPPARSQESLNKVILEVHEAGLQACVHSNGDREIEMVLNAFQEALKQKPRENHRHRIEHCSVVTEEILQRIQRLGLVIAPHSYIWEHGDKMEAYGEWRWDWMHPARALLDRGIPMAGTSDYGVSAAEPLLRVQDLVTRTSAEGKVYGAKQRITAEEALRAWTLGGAYASFEEDRKGSIIVGKLADFVVLSADPTRVETNRIKDITVEMTVVGGRKVLATK